MDHERQEPLLPFKVGQLAESKSFVEGFRGAWFRCRIKGIRRQRGHIEHALKFIDFPGEKIKWTKLYEKPPISRIMLNEEKMQLMVRPTFPRIYKKCELPDINNISKVIVVVNDVWKVGDLVDWWTDCCFWSGRITQALAEDRVEVELPPPPLGEGKCYEVSCKDLRPSLDWSLEVGWTVPTSKEPENFCSCARLIRPVNQVAEALSNPMVRLMNVGRKEDVQGESGSTVEARSLPPSDKSDHSRATDLLEQPLSASGSKEETHIPGTNIDLDVKTNIDLDVETDIDLDVATSGIGRTGRSDSASSSHVRDDSDETTRTRVGYDDQHYNSGSSKKLRTCGSFSLCSDSLEASIMNLEELVNKVKWLKGIIDSGDLNAMRPPWEFLEHRPSAVQK